MYKNKFKKRLARNNEKSKLLAYRKYSPSTCAGICYVYTLELSKSLSIIKGFKHKCRKND